GPASGLEAEAAQVRKLGQAEQVRHRGLARGPVLRALDAGLQVRRADARFALRVVAGLGQAVTRANLPLAAPQDHLGADGLRTVEDDRYLRGLGDDLEDLVGLRLPALRPLAGSEGLNDSVSDVRVSRGHAP